MEDNDSIFGPIPGHLDANLSMVVKKPITIEEFRKTNPQECIDYLLRRKELYKNTAIKHFRQVKNLEEEKAKLNIRIKKLQIYREKYLRESAVKKAWKSTALIFGIALLTLISVILVISQLTPKQTEMRVPVSGKNQNVPNHVLASVNLLNGDIQGSGTIISKGDRGAILLTAAHNFRGNVGGLFWVYYPDGTYTKASLLAFDRERDLAVATVDPNTIIAHSFVPKKLPSEGNFSGCGYTNGEGPNYRILTYNYTYKNNKNRVMWDMTAIGPFWNGDSGSGVFMGESCVGVTSQRDALTWIGQNTYQKKLYACSHQEIIGFLEDNKELLKEYGDWSIQPIGNQQSEDSPPLWVPKSNLPLNLGTKRLDLLEKDVQDLKKKFIPALRKPSEVK